MSEDNDDGESKEFAPSQRRLERAREQGDTARSEELQAAAATWGLLIVLAAAGGWIVTHFASTGMTFLANPDRIALEWPVLLPAILNMVAPVALLILAPAIIVLAWLITSQGLVFAPSRLAFKPSRLSIPQNAKQKFGRSGLADFARRSLKLLAVGIVLALYLQKEAEILMISPAMGASHVAATMGQQVLGFLLVVALLSTVFGIADFFWQRVEFMRRNRMTRKEMTDEMKDSEGDPHMKADRRRRAEEIAARQMMAEVPKADVIIVNPTHYAVALRWKRETGRPPVCVAKGVDEVAARIRARAQEAGVPLHEDPPTARALHATVEIGQEIRREHFAAVAAAIRFADAMRKKAREQGWRRHEER